MMIATTAGIPIDSEILHNYFRNLVNHFFKILPIREQKEESLTTYMQSLQAELQQLQNSLQAPVLEKVQKVVEDLAKSKGFAAVFEKNSLLYIDSAVLYDLTPEARVALNIPEGRTLEQLQQELAAKAQAAQGM